MSAIPEIKSIVEKVDLKVVFSSDSTKANAMRLNLATVGKCRNRECRAKVFPLLYQMSRVISESSDLSHIWKQEQY
jgi:hypothetical protein